MLWYEMSKNRSELGTPTLYGSAYYVALVNVAR